MGITILEVITPGSQSLSVKDMISVHLDSRFDSLKKISLLCLDVNPNNRPSLIEIMYLLESFR